MGISKTTQSHIKLPNIPYDVKILDNSSEESIKLKVNSTLLKYSKPIKSTKNVRGYRNISNLVVKSKQFESL